MAEYIDREALCKILENWLDAHADADDEQGCGLLEDVICEVDAQTAADVAPVVHAYWIPCDNGGYFCSNCDKRAGFRFDLEYCPRCGAKMDGGVENG